MCIFSPYLFTSNWYIDILQAPLQKFLMQSVQVVHIIHILGPDYAHCIRHIGKLVSKAAKI